MIQGVGAAWLMVASSASPQMIALVQAMIGLPVVLFTLFAGALADNMDRCKVMLAAQHFLFVTALTLAVLARLGVVTPWMLLGFTFLTANFTDLSDKASTPLPGTINVAYDHADIP